MRKVTRLMIDEFKIEELGYDFMGYSSQKGDKYTFHHLIIPKRRGGLTIRENGAILFTAPHQYLHIIELYEVDIYNYITQELVAMNQKGFLDIENLIRIHEALEFFEQKYENKYTTRGKKLIRDKYKNRVEF